MLSVFIVKHFSRNNLSLITMGMRCCCAQAEKQVDKCKIYLAISSYFVTFKIDIRYLQFIYVVDNKLLLAFYLILEYFTFKI